MRLANTACARTVPIRPTPNKIKPTRPGVCVLTKIGFNCIELFYNREKEKGKRKKKQEKRKRKERKRKRKRKKEEDSQVS